MTSKARFEAWYPGDKQNLLLSDGGSYLFPAVQRRFGTWQAAERDMLERCVKVLEDDAARQRAAWDAHIASNVKANATDYSAFPRAYADKLKELLND